MKKYTITFLISFIYLLGFSQHNEFKIDFSYGIAGGVTPTYKELNDEDAISKKKANELVRYFLEESKMDFKSVYNGCQNRAMVMSLMLNDKQISHLKIWNFDPFKIALYNKQDALDVDDPLGIKSGKIYWDFHVAVVILVKNDSTNKNEKYVIDPSFSDLPLTISEWLSIQNSPNSHYTFLNPEWYNFVTLQPNSSIVCNNKSSNIVIPNCFPYIITGDFYKYSSVNFSPIAEELAVNQQITDFTTEIIKKLDETDSNKKIQLSELFSNFNSIKAILKGENTLDTSHPFNQYLTEYKKSYTESLNYWLKQLNN
ncbi:MAG: protein-glutamine glutaminase family protein [Kordia sp.]|uniref:protein-glutamine glutaminase family protein n=1 Tax=Kordia sp. TaxID=1965332 RepID=UPI00385E01CA